MTTRASFVPWRLMSRSASWLVALTCWLAPPPASSGLKAEPLAPHVILVSIDGLAAYYLNDPQASLPTLRRLRAEGASAAGLRVSNPAITWPNHTSLVTGVHPDRHGVLWNGTLIRLPSGGGIRIDDARNQRDLVAVPTLFDQLHAAGYRTAAVNWPCTRGSSTLDDNLPDVPNQLAHTTPRLRAELIRAGILPGHDSATFRHLGAPACDQAWSATASHLVRSRKPNLLLLHLLATDSIQHQYGPRSPAAYAAVALADAHVADLLRSIETAGLRDQTTVFITSDHGFERVNKLVNPNVLLRRAGLLRPGARRVEAVSHGGTAFVFLTDAAKSEEDLSRATNLLRGQEGIAQIHHPAAFPDWRFPIPSLNPQIGDLFLVAAEGYAFSDDPYDNEVVRAFPSSAGSHGNAATNATMNGILIAWGRDIKRGVRLGLVDIIDVAPTVAAIFRQTIPGAEGRILREIVP